MDLATCGSEKLCYTVPPDCKEYKQNCTVFTWRDNGVDGTTFRLSGNVKTSVAIGIGIQTKIETFSESNPDVSEFVLGDDIDHYYCFLIAGTRVLPSSNVNKFTGKSDLDLFQCEFTRPYDRIEHGIDVRLRKYPISVTLIEKLGSRFVSTVSKSADEFDFLDNGSSNRFEKSKSVKKGMPSWGLDLIRKYYTRTAKSKDNIDKAVENKILTTVKPRQMFSAVPKNQLFSSTTTRTQFIPMGFARPVEVKFQEKTKVSENLFMKNRLTTTVKPTTVKITTVAPTTTATTTTTAPPVPTTTTTTAPATVLLFLSNRYLHFFPNTIFTP